MRALPTIFLLGLWLCGCSRGSDDPGSRSALDLVQAGKDISFGRYVLHIEKREGSSVEGVRIVSTDLDGQTVTIKAKRGTLSQTSDQPFIALVLYDAETEKAKQKAVVTELNVNLPTVGIHELRKSRR